MKIRRALQSTILIVGVLLSAAGCSELAGSGELVAIPQVTFTCSSSNCTPVGGTNQFRVIYSEFDCSGAGGVSFYAKRSATGLNLSCTGASCSGTASSWIDENGLRSTQIPSGNYTVCVVVFKQGSITAGPTAQDAWGKQEGVSVTASQGTVSVTSFSDGFPP